MINAEIFDVYAVYGDSGCCGKGSLLGVFTDEEKAEKASKGRGNMDCGGDGSVEKRKAILQDGYAYLLELDHPIWYNQVVVKNPSYDEATLFKIKIVKVYKTIEFMRAIRSLTGMGLKEVKDLYNKVQESNGFVLNNTPGNLSGDYSSEEVEQWKYALLGLAEVEIQ